MTLSQKTSSAFLLLFFLLTTPTTAENKTPMIQSGNGSCTVTHPNHFSLLFETCNPNFNPEEYYSTALTHLSYIYLAFSFVYLLSLLFWISISLKIKQHFRRIPFLMAELILMKLITLICATEDRYYEKITGSRILPDLLIFAHQIIGSVRLFIIILLIGHVWPLVKPCLQLIDLTVLSIMIPLRILCELAAIIIGEYGYVNNRKSIWNEMITVVDVLINPCYMMISYTVWTYRIRARVSTRLELVRAFYIIATIYLTFVRMFTVFSVNGDYKLNAVEAYEYLLKSNLAVEGNGLVFYGLSFRLFNKFFNGIE